ncbi:hypothetical protein [Dubosiella newyorkensis]|uniref:hypothetical protein n=2 Tax=Dubosiella newyorkensis TaxID=1862672 RepID=UPI0023F1752E|nr:hypothetical protein [Dubosiella newyorkensis]
MLENKVEIELALLLLLRGEHSTEELSDTFSSFACRDEIIKFFFDEMMIESEKANKLRTLNFSDQNEAKLILSEIVSKDERVKEMKSLFGAFPNIYGEEALQERLMKL